MDSKEKLNEVEKAFRSVYPSISIDIDERVLSRKFHYSDILNDISDIVDENKALNRKKFYSNGTESAVDQTIKYKVRGIISNDKVTLTELRIWKIT